METMTRFIWTEVNICGMVGTAIEQWMSTDAMAACPNHTQPQKASLLWNAMVSPFTPMVTAGFLWWQGESNEGGSSPLLVPLPAVSWPRVPAWGSLEPPRRDGENAQKTRKNGEKMGEIQPNKCEGREPRSIPTI